MSTVNPLLLGLLTKWKAGHIARRLMRKMHTRVNRKSSEEEAT